MKYQDVIEHFGSKEAVAAQLKISIATVFRWSKRGIDRHYQLAIQTLTKNKLKADGE